MARTNKSRHALLALLSLGPRSGYDIQRDIRQTIGHFWNESYGQIYPSLRAIVEDGLATVRTEPQVGKPDRNVYTITREGLAALRAWLEVPPEPPPVRNEMLLKIFVGWQTAPATLIDHVTRLLEHYTGNLEQYAHFEKFLRRSARENPDAYFWLISLRSGQLYAEARRQWCDETLSIFKKVEKAERDNKLSPAERSRRMAKLMRTAHETFQAAGTRQKALS